ncbi:flagellin [Paenibacillus sp. FJAT-26967]|uniref:flagellin n=1 Tax=Paenibacillus sp. FJAT-26967 TaxID=1729690 RepID=UPI0008396DD4
MRIAHNLSAMRTKNQLQANSKKEANSIGKLSSGYRLNRAADDAAGLSISEGMRAQIRGLEQAQRNAQDGIVLIQTAEGALGEIHAILQRMNELGVQSATDTYADNDRMKIQAEMNQLKEEIDRIANTTTFNTIHLLNGDIGGGEITKIAGKDYNTLNLAAIVGNSHNIHMSGGLEIQSGINDELTVKFDGQAYTIKITAGTYDGSTTALYQDINDKLQAAGAPVKLHSVYSSWDSTHMKNILESKISGEHRIEVEGSGFADLFGQTQKYFGNYEVWGREADFSTGYTVKAGVNDTLNIRVSGVDKTIVLQEGSYTRNELAAELNKRFGETGADISASFSGSVGVNDSPAMGNNHYILALKHNRSGANDTIQLLSGNALNPLFLRSTQPGATWNPSSTSKIVTNLDIASGIDIKDGNNEWEFTVEGNQVRKVTVPSGTYTSTSIIATLNQVLSDRNAGVIALNEGDKIVFAREMNGSSYSLTDFKMSGIKDGLILQVGANQGEIMKISLPDIRTNKLGIHQVDLTTQSGASQAITKISEAVDRVSSERASLGAYQNRLEHTINYLGNSSENLISAESRIRDADMAKEIAELTKIRMLTQAAQAMAAQANQAPQQVLQLLR